MAHAKHAHLAACNGGSGKRVTRRTRIAFHVVIGGGNIHALRHIEIAQFFVFDLDTETLHHVHREFDIRGRNKFILHVDVERRLAVRGADKERRQVLARNVAVHFHVAALKARSIDMHRGIAFRFAVLDVGAKRPQGIDKVADRAFAHAFLALQQKLAGTQRECRRQRTHRRAGIPQVQIHRFLYRDRARITGHHCLGIIARKFNFHAQLLESLTHIARIVALEQVVEPGRAARKGGNQEGPVGNALGTREADFAAKRTKSR